VTDAELRHHSQELGWMGKIFGSKDNAPGNIAGFAVIISMAMLAILLMGKRCTEPVEERRRSGDRGLCFAVTRFSFWPRQSLGGDANSERLSPSA
jgi:hypothetical protein